jgi:lysozyme
MNSMTPKGRRWLSRLEGGPVLDAYLDSAGIWTIGVGSTYWPDTKLPIKKGDRIATLEIADGLFTEVLKEFEEKVDSCIAPNGRLIRYGGPLPGHITDPLISLCFNIGKRAFASSTALKRFNGNFPMKSVAEAMSWFKNPGLVSRRRAETDCLLFDVYHDQAGNIVK